MPGINIVTSVLSLADRTLEKEFLDSGKLDLVHAFSLSASSCGIKEHFFRCSQPHILCMYSKVIVE